PIEADDLGFQQIFDFGVDLLVGRMRLDKSCRIRRGLAISEDRFVKYGLGELRASGSWHDPSPRKREIPNNRPCDHKLYVKYITFLRWTCVRGPMLSLDR